MKALRSAIVVALALTAFASLAGVAAAEEVLLRPAGRITQAGRITLSTGEGIEITCSVTLLGTLATSFMTTEGAHMGALEGIVSAECRGGALTTGFLRESTELTLWRVLRTGEVILGFLYRHRIGILIENGFFACLYGGTLEALIEAEGNILRHATILRGNGIGLMRRLGGLLECPSTLFASGSLTLEPSQTFSVR